MAALRITLPWLVDLKYSKSIFRNNSASFNIAISKDASGRMVLYDFKGNAKTFKKANLFTTSNLISQAIAVELVHGHFRTIEIVLDLESHLVRLNNLKTNRNFIFPVSPNLTLPDNCNMFGVWTAIINNDDNNIKFDNTKELFRLISLWISTDMNLVMEITDKFIFASFGNIYRCFKIDLDSLFGTSKFVMFTPRSGLISSGAVFMKIHFINRTAILLIVNRKNEMKYAHAFKLPFASKYYRKDINEFVNPKFIDNLRNMQYDQYVSDDEVARIEKLINRFVRSREFHRFLLRIIPLINK